MAAGIQTTQAQINASAGQFATQLRTTFQQVLNFQAWLNTVGSAGLTGTYGFSTADAATLISAIGNLASLAGIYQGGAAGSPALPFNFESNSNALWGGQ